jgi:uncharacterized lipoprotein YmbA
MMRNIICQSSRWVTVFAMVFMLSGCIGRSSPKVTYFSLLTAEQLNTGQALAALPEVKLGIGPVTIPDSLKRSQIATRQQGNQYQFDEFNRWAGILEKDLSYVLGENLGQLLGIDNIGFFPWMPHFQPTYRVMIDIVRLDGSFDGDAVLNAHWVVADSTGKEFLAGGRSEYHQPLEAKTYSALIKAESQLVAQMSHEIATAIATLNK